MNTDGHGFARSFGFIRGFRRLRRQPAPERTADVVEVAAALGVAGALRRRRTAVITVDPAQRLKDTLGLERLSTQPHAVPLGRANGHLDALAIDTKRTFDALIARVAPSVEIANRIFANRLYQELSNELGGSTEYMAMEKLHELLHHEPYELVVVDTPPSTHARDLLTAPLRLLDLLASSAVRILKAPTSLLSGSESGFARVTLRAILKALQRWTGMPSHSPPAATAVSSW